MSYKTEYASNFIILLDKLGAISATAYINAMLSINVRESMNDYAMSIRHDHE